MALDTGSPWNMPYPESTDDVRVNEDIQALAAQVHAKLVGLSQPLFIRKTSDETIISSAVQQDDDALVLAVLASKTYHMRCAIQYVSGSTPDLAISWGVPTGATLDWTFQNGAGPFTEVSPAVGISTTGSLEFAVLEGVLRVSSTAGNLRFRWAQNTSTASNTTVKAKSWLMLTPVGPTI